MDDQLNEFLEIAGVGRPTTIELAKRLTDRKETVDITLKRPIEPPVRQESPPRNHVFWSIDGFAKYVAKYSTDDVVILADPVTGTICAVLDDKADKGFETIHFLAMPHSRWVTWQQMLGKQIPVKEFGKFLLTQKGVIVAPARDLLVQQFAQVRASKKIEYQVGYGDGSTNGVMIEVEIRGQQPGQQLVKLPTVIQIQCPMFIGRPDLEIAIDVILDTKGNEVVVELYAGDAEELKISSIQGMIDEVAAAMPNKLVSLGSIQHAWWNYVKPEK